MTKELRKLAEAATQGKWESEDTRLYFPCLIGGFDLRHGQNGKANAAYIAAANPAAILDLLDRLEKADALVKAIKTDRHDWEDWPDDSREALRAMEASK